MPISVEARGVYVSDRLAELYLTATHLPEDHEVEDFRALVAQLLATSPTSILVPEDLAQLMNENRRFLRRSWDWNGDASSLANRFVRALVLGTMDGRVSVEWPPHPMMYPEWEMSLRDTGLGAVRARLGMDLATRLSWLPTIEDGFEDEIASLFAHEVPIGQSPQLQRLTIADLVKDARSIAFVPMAAGALVTPGALACGNWLLAILAPLAGGGAGVVLAGSILLVDKLLSSVRTLDARAPKPTKRVKTPSKRALKETDTSDKKEPDDGE